MKPGRLLLWLLLLAACDDMSQQAKYEAYEAAELFPDNKVNQTPVPGTVPRDAVLTPRRPPQPTPDLIARGADRYAIFCAPCHGPAGAGDGPVAQRTIPTPPDLLSPQVTAKGPAHLVWAMETGPGVMYSYADRLDFDDRWAIAYWLAEQRGIGR